MRIITLDDMMQDIYNGLHMLPSDIDLIIGVPRSGMIPAIIISEQIQRPLSDIDSFCNGIVYSNGKTGRVYQKDKIKKILVVEDSSNSGNSIRRAKLKLSSSWGG